ncbi:GNAT family protein [Streptomyces sp. NPDC007162]|uniref:GNAT family N-acetyltransferase n=1 Tax=Streptomyces sp. NPDC007162 TaxID=3156917 RepID=UPI0033F6BCB8
MILSKIEESLILPDVILRPIAIGDAKTLCAAYAVNRSHLAPWEPVRPESFFTVDGQTERIDGLLKQAADGVMLPLLMESVPTGGIVGAITLSGITLGPFCSSYVGYWVAGDQQGRGLATAALERVCEIAEEVVGLHRIEASTLIDNTTSQRVLKKCGFETIGDAPQYLHINGEWRDSRLFQRILHHHAPAL